VIFCHGSAGAAPSPCPGPAEALAAKGVTEASPARSNQRIGVLDRLDALLPARDPVATLGEWLEQLREDEFDFLELGSEEMMIEGKVFLRFAGARQRLGLARCGHAAPPSSSLGAAPLALAGLAPRSLFRANLKAPFPRCWAKRSTSASSGRGTAPLAAVRAALAQGNVWPGSTPRRRRQRCGN